MQSFTRAIFILVALVGPACAPEDDLEFRTTLGGGGGSGGGTVFNTHALEKRRFSELTPAHEDSLGVALVDVELGDGAGVASFAVVDGALVVEDDRGEKREGAALVGSRWWVGNAFWLPQAPIEIAEVAEVDGVTHYVFVHQGDGGLVKNCVGATDGLVRVLSGVSLDEQTGDLTPSPTTTFLACTNGAIGKAAAWGYYDLARALDDLEVFETAVRVVRADYCYDGESHTAAGVPLLVEDMWGVREPAAAGRPIEAVWGPHGLVCAGEPRQAGHGPIACDGVAVPACDGKLTKQVDAWFVTRLP